MLNKEATGTTEKPKDNNKDNKGAATNNNQKSDTNNTKDNTKTDNSNANPLQVIRGEVQCKMILS